MTVFAQILDPPFFHVYPLPLSAYGVRKDLPFEAEHVIQYARCEREVMAQVSEINLDRLGHLDVYIDILQGDCGVQGLCAGNSVWVQFRLSDCAPHVRPAMLQNLLDLHLAAGVNLRTMQHQNEILHRPFRMSVAVPCQ